MSYEATGVALRQGCFVHQREQERNEKMKKAKYLYSENNNCLGGGKHEKEIQATDHARKCTFAKIERKEGHEQ